MKNTNELKAEIEKKYKHFTQKETVDILLTNGFSEDEIKSEIFNYFSKDDEKTIKNGFSYMFSLIVLSVISIMPIFGYIYLTEVFYVIFSLCLVSLTYGYFKLNKKSILIWLGIMVFFELIILLILFTKLSGGYINSFYSYHLLISLFLFFGLVTTKIFEVYTRNRKLVDQYNFK